MRISNRSKSSHIPCVTINAIVRTDRSFANRKARIEDKTWINFKSTAESSTYGACTLWRVKAKQTRLQLRNLFFGVIHAGITLRKDTRRIIVNIQNLDDPSTKIKRLLNRLGNTTIHITAHSDTIYNDLYIVFKVFLKIRKLIKR